MTKTATKIRRLTDFLGDAALYRLEPPTEEGEHEYVAVSSVDAYSGPETLVFPAAEDGEVSDWLEIAGTRGDWSHAGALAELGYEVTS